MPLDEDPLFCRSAFRQNEIIYKLFEAISLQGKATRSGFCYPLFEGGTLYDSSLQLPIQLSPGSPAPLLIVFSASTCTPIFGVHSSSSTTTPALLPAKATSAASTRAAARSLLVPPPPWISRYASRMSCTPPDACVSNPRTRCGPQASPARRRPPAERDRDGSLPPKPWRHRGGGGRGQLWVTQDACL